VIEVIETPEIVTVGNNIQAPIMTQGEWMKGCPEGGEQGFLFQLYSKISNEPSICPDGNCAQPFPPQKTLFFAIWVCIRVFSVSRILFHCVLSMIPAEILRLHERASKARPTQMHQMLYSFLSRL
jgi:hypothetical protein